MRQEDGFTLVEMVIVAVITSILVIIIGQFFVARTIEANRTFTLTTLQNNTKLAVNTVAKQIKSAVYVEATNNAPDNNSPCSSGNQYCWASSATTLVLAVPALDSSGNVIYSNALHTAVYADDVIFYLGSGSILYERVLANPNAPGDAAVSTCAPSDVPSKCSRSDIKVVENVASLSMVYYDTANNVLPASSASTAGSVQITLSQTLPAGGKTLTSSFTGQATLRNK